MVQVRGWARAAVLPLMVFLCVMMLGASSCEEKVAESNGVKIVQGPDGKWYTEVDPGGGKVGQVVKVAKDATEGTPLAPLAAGASLLANLFQGILKKRADSEADRRNKEHEKAHLATNIGLTRGLQLLPPDLAHAVAASIDTAHDSMGVEAGLQDKIQPTLPALRPAG